MDVKPCSSTHCIRAVHNTVVNNASLLQDGHGSQLSNSELSMESVFLLRESERDRQRDRKREREREREREEK